MSKIPILFLAYNRLECTKKSLNSILRYKPNNIYISCDGPKNKGLDKKKTAEVRNFIVERTKKIKGARYIFNKKNLGCKKSNIKGIVLKSNENIVLDKKKCIKFANKNNMFIAVK